MAVASEISKFLNLSRQFTSKDRRSDALEKWRKLMAECCTLFRLAARSAPTIQSLR